MDALFNRNGETCQALYKEVRDPKPPSVARCNIEKLTGLLNDNDVPEVLETNVICYSASKAKCLNNAEHIGGLERGKEIFWKLLDSIEPIVLIAHGVDTAKDLSRVLDQPVGPPPRSEPVEVVFEKRQLKAKPKGKSLSVLVIPTLAPPGYYTWHTWAWKNYLPCVASKAADLVVGSSGLS